MSSGSKMSSSSSLLVDHSSAKPANAAPGLVNALSGKASAAQARLQRTQQRQRAMLQCHNTLAARKATLPLEPGTVANKSKTITMYRRQCFSDKCKLKVGKSLDKSTRRTARRAARSATNPQPVEQPPVAMEE